MADEIDGARPLAAAEPAPPSQEAELRVKVAELAAAHATLEAEVKALRQVVERVIEHRQQSHGELVLLLTSLVSRLPLGDVGGLISRLVEHNTQVSEALAHLAKGHAVATLPQPSLLQALEQVKKDLAAVACAAVEELRKLETPLELDLLEALVANPELFFSPRAIRACRCYIKGLVPRERVVREFGEAVLGLFDDTTTDPKRNPRPRPEEIALAFKPDFEARLDKQPDLSPELRQRLLAFYRKVQRSRANTPEARAQRDAFARLSFVLDLRHYYDHRNTEPVDVVFAQRLPALIEQVALPAEGQPLEEAALQRAEQLLALVLSPEHRVMIVNNLGKSGGPGRTLRFVLRLRMAETADLDQVIPEFVRHLLPTPPQPPPSASALAAVLKFIPVERQRRVAQTLRFCDRLPKEKARKLARELADELGLGPLEEPPRPVETAPPELDRQAAWDSIRDLLKRRASPAAVAAAIRQRIHTHYDAEELRQSWLVLTEVEPVSFIRVFCHLPYREDGTTDPVAQAALRSYVDRLLHDKYAAVRHKVVTSLRNLHKAKPDNPVLRNFLALVKWVDADAAAKLAAEAGILDFDQ